MNNNIFPQIRLKGFQGEWLEKIVGDICKISTGKSNTQDKVDDGNYPFYVRSPQIEKSNRYLYDEEAVLTVGDGVGTGKVFHYVNGKYDLHQRVYRMYDFKDLYAKFFYYLFSIKFYKRVMAMTAKSSVDSVRMDMIADMHILSPEMKEQQVIAEYFSSLDSLISATTSHISSLKQIKEASLQSMFLREGENAPKVRFKGFNEDWKKVKLEDCLEINLDRNIDNVYGKEHVLSVSDEEGVVNQIKLLGRSFAGKSVSNYKILRPNQIVYTKSPLKAKPYGIVKVNKGETGIVSVLYAVYDAKESIYPDFIHYYFDPCYRINNYLLPLVNKGAKNTMNISDEMALQGFISIPSYEEQIKIASYFQNLDKQITLQTQRLVKLKQIKSACLDKMFV